MPLLQLQHKHLETVVIGIAEFTEAKLKLLVELVYRRLFLIRLDGEVAYFVGTVGDISGNHLAHRDLQEVEDKVLHELLLPALHQGNLLLSVEIQVALVLRAVFAEYFH